jgi:tetratricopeptide (TPR) repeat protein
MKQIITILLLTIMPLGVFSQNKDKTYERQIAKQDSMANLMFLKENFIKSLEIRQKQLDIMKKTTGENDSSYIMHLIQLGNCYYRLEKLDKAIETAQKVIDLYGTSVSNKDKMYALVLDNLAFYQCAANKYKDGMENCKKAIALYEQFQTNDFDMSVILMHMAELYHYTGDNTNAIKYELRGLGILKNLYGEHSQKYLEEVPYLKTYYEDNGDNDKATKLAESLNKLQKEADNGEVDLPEDIKFDNAAKAHAHNYDVQRCIDYFFTHYVFADKIIYAASYILKWSIASDDCNIVEGNATQLKEHEKSMLYFIAYIAGCSEYALKSGKADFSMETYKYAMKKVLYYYEANKKYTGEVSYLEKYVTTANKNNDKFIKLLEKNYPGPEKKTNIKAFNYQEKEEQGEVKNKK